MGEDGLADVRRQMYSELETLRQFGVDLTDPDEVVAGLDAYDFDTTLEWVLDNPEAYVRTVQEGMVDGMGPSGGDPGRT